jgi:hypothetical protein
MQGFEHRTTSAVHPNIFTTQFLCRMAERDEPPTAGDADVAGPWRIEAIPGCGFGLFRVGESLARGFAPVAMFPSRWLALLTAAVLPGTGRDPLVRVDKQPDADDVYPLLLPGLDGEEVVGQLRLFAKRRPDAPSVRTDDTMFRTDDSSVRRDGPSVRTDDTMLRTDDSWVRRDGPSVRTDVTMFRTDDSSVRPDAPSVRPDVTIF